jgi:hypothetical protein
MSRRTGKLLVAHPVGAVSKKRRQHRTLIVVGFVAAQICETRLKSGLFRNIVEQLGEPHMRHQRTNLGG